MLFFHGTRGARALVDAIARDGLRAFPHAWAHERVGAESSTFLSNAPVAGHGGDPVAFAMGYRLGGGPRSRGDGWIIVVDLDPRTDGLVRAVVPNLALEQFFAARSMKALLTQGVFTLDASGALRRRVVGPPVIADVLEELGRRRDLDRVARALRPVLVGKYSDLHPEAISFATWRRYADALRSARTVAEVVRAGRRLGVTWDRPEVVHCELCIQGMAYWAYALDEPLACAGGARVALPASHGGRDPFGDGLAPLARTVARWYASASREAVRAGFERLYAAPVDERSWSRLVALTPLDPRELPAPWRDDFGRGWTLADLRATDVQVVCDAIAPRHILGALRVAAGARLRPWARPDGGQTLAAKLWHGARTLRERYLGRPLVYDG